MLHEITLELGGRLRDLGCPIPVIDGDDDASAHATTTYGRERIIVEHDDDAGDSFDLPRSQHARPSLSMRRIVGAKVTIYGQSTKSGARPFEHRRRVEHALDLVVAALSDVVQVRKNLINFTGGRFIRPQDLERTELGSGAVYEMKFTVDRGIKVQNWAYETAPTLAVAGDLIRNRTDVFGTDPNAAAEVACGGT